RPWFENLIAHGLKDDEQALFACVVDGNDVLAVLPLLKRADENYYALSNNFTSLYTLLLADGNQQAIIECLAKGLSGTAFEYLVLQPVDAADAAIRHLQGALKAHGFSCYRSFRFDNWMHRVEGQSFIEYMDGRPARLRNTIARKQRKLEREHGYEIRLFIDNNIEEALSDYGTAYKASWKGGEFFRDFVPGLVNRLAGRGWPRLAVLYVDGKPVAAQIWFVVHGRASIFRLLYDEAWKAYSPGSILTSYLVEYVIDTDKVDEIDFLTGNERYKQDWMTVCRQRKELVCTRKLIPERGRHRTIEWLRRVANR
ncbi:MAG: GNAT family N-acetyltransferase, partial [Gammaproteobacteria bacterium]